MTVLDYEKYKEKLAEERLASLMRYAANAPEKDEPVRPTEEEREYAALARYYETRPDLVPPDHKNDYICPHCGNWHKAGEPHFSDKMKAMTKMLHANGI